MKNLLATILSLAVALTLLVSCVPAEDNSASDSHDDTNINNPISEYFKKEVKYDAFTPAENIALPIDGSSVWGHVQIEKTLYILGEGCVYTQSLETGESAKLFDISANGISTHGEKLYLFNSETGEISEYSLSGEKLASKTVEALANWNLFDFEVTDSYFVVNLFRYMTEEHPAQKQIVTVRRDDYTVETEKKVKDGYYELCQYKGDELLLVYAEQGGANNTDCLNSFDAKTGEIEKLRGLSIGQSYFYCFDICYNPKANTAVLALRLDGTLLWEFSLDSQDNALLDKIGGLYDGVPDFDCVSVSVYENVVSLVGDTDNRYECFDYNDPPEHITVFCVDVNGGSIGTYDLYTIASNYEMNNDVIIRFTIYDDPQLVTTRLMAGDEDMDIYCTAFNTGPANVIRQQAYVDLSQFESLADKISSSIFVSFASKVGEGYFGLPYSAYCSIDEHLIPNSFTAIEQYCIKNIDMETGEYLDPEGEELFKVLKHHFKNPKGAEKELYDFPYSTVQTDYLVINPASKKQELAADFLEYLFDAESGNIELTPTITSSAKLFYSYPELESTENMYLMWRMQANGVVDTIYQAYHDALETDGSASQLKALAKEAARGYRMRLEG